MKSAFGCLQKLILKNLEPRKIKTGTEEGKLIKLRSQLGEKKEKKKKKGTTHASNTRLRRDAEKNTKNDRREGGKTVKHEMKTGISHPSQDERTARYKSDLTVERKQKDRSGVREHVRSPERGGAGTWFKCRRNIDGRISITGDGEDRKKKRPIEDDGNLRS